MVAVTMAARKTKCSTCGKVLIPHNNEKKVRANRRYCGERCRTQYNSKKLYHRMKNNPKFKEYRRKYFNKWLDKNRDHFNEMMRNWMRQKKLEEVKVK